MEEGSDANRRGEDNGVPRPGFAVEDRQQRVIGDEDGEDHAGIAARLGAIVHEEIADGHEQRGDGAGGLAKAPADGARRENAQCPQQNRRQPHQQDGRLWTDEPDPGGIEKMIVVVMDLEKHVAERFDRLEQPQGPDFV